MSPLELGEYSVVTHFFNMKLNVPVKITKNADASVFIYDERMCARASVLQT